MSGTSAPRVIREGGIHRWTIPVAEPEPLTPDDRAGVDFWVAACHAQAEADARRPVRHAPHRRTGRRSPRRRPVRVGGSRRSATTARDDGDGGSDPDGPPPPPEQVRQYAVGFGLTVEQVAWCSECGAVAPCVDDYQRRELDRRGFIGGVCPDCWGQA